MYVPHVRRVRAERARPVRDPGDVQCEEQQESTVNTMSNSLTGEGTESRAGMDEPEDGVGLSRWARVGRGLLWFSAIGPAIVALIVVGAFCLLAADWWPWEDNSDSGLAFISLIFAAYVLVPAGVVWLIGAIASLAGARLRSRWFLAAPAVLVFGAALVIALRFLVPQDFDDSEAELTEFAQEAQSREEGSYESFDPPRTIGHVEVDSLKHDRPGSFCWEMLMDPPSSPVIFGHTRPMAHLLCAETKRTSPTSAGPGTRYPEVGSPAASGPPGAP